jgi:hypothetical protein
MKSEIRSASVLFFAATILLCDIASGGEIIAFLKVSAPRADRAAVSTNAVPGAWEQQGDFVDVPVHAAIELPKRLVGVPLQNIRVRVQRFSDSVFNVSVPGQLVLNDKGKVEVCWVAPRLKANSRTEWTVGVPVPDRPNTGFGPVEVFSWQDKDGEYLDLLFDGDKVTRYDLQALSSCLRYIGEPADKRPGRLTPVSEE